MSYDLKPKVNIKQFRLALKGYEKITDEIKKRLEKMNSRGRKVLVVECYPGVRDDEIKTELIASLHADVVIHSDSCFLDAGNLNEEVKSTLTDDRVFGIMSHYRFEDFLLKDQTEKVKEQVENSDGLVVIYGTGASVIYDQYDILIYADLSRWEIQCRHRSGIPNWKADNPDEDAKRKFKRGYFFEWRVADRQKQKVYEKIDYLLDTTIMGLPKMISGEDYRNALRTVTHRPFRVVPYFDQSVWGGKWMMETFHLDPSKVNYGWGFDGLPEENSLILNFGEVEIEVPSINLVFAHPVELLGEKVKARFGKEFPIRFDFLDTVGGGNLSLQVHPLVEYIQDTFGMHYTQDESYYILHSEEDSSVYLGLKADVDFQELEEDLQKAEIGEFRFPDEKFINHFSARKHDHYSIPSGTVHCQGKNTVVLEISATPYIFTFKLWDWGRVDFDGLPRPIHLEHGLKNIVKERDTKWVEENLINRFKGIPDLNEQDPVVEKTGLHHLEFVETLRHWFKNDAIVETFESVNMLNLVEGGKITVESVDSSFEPFEVHYAETFIVPASVKQYRLVNKTSSDKPVCVLQAFVRNPESKFH
ncbi:class I mannose-6-phosphate isomerase [Cytobacillus sp. Hz8]|uniref:class I mannose-6-phosphate isomerase n=1 Tax=Cytobacillus sp. Hz8 TaxID=3347168 RepID=UPI0035D7F36E